MMQNYKCKKGSTLIMAVTVMSMLLVAAGALMIRNTLESRLGERTLNRSNAFQLAEAGLDQAALNLKTPDTADDILSDSLSTGSFSLVVEDAGVSGSIVKHVTSTGISSNDARILEAFFQLTPKSVFQFAVFGDEQVNVSGSAITDSFDSEDGPYEDDPSSPGYNKDDDGDIGVNAVSEGGVTISGSIFIDGHIAVGPGVENPESVVTGYDSNLITGDPKVVSQPTEFSLPEVTVPPEITCQDYTVSGNTTTVLLPGEYCYDNLTIQGGGTLTGDGTGQITIYLVGSLTARGDSTLGVVDDPTKMLVLLGSTTGDVTLEEGTITGSTEFYGALYAPDTTINITGNAEVFGAIISNRINLSGSSVIHYDEALEDLSDISSTYQVKRTAWQEINP